MCSQSEAQPWICMTSDRNMFVRIENLWNDLIICKEISNQALRCYYHCRMKTRKNSQLENRIGKQNANQNREQCRGSTSLLKI
jgi:hypothetical protein